MLKNKKSKFMCALMVSSIILTANNLDVANAGGLFDFGAYETTEETVQETEASEEAVDLTGGGLFDFGTETNEATVQETVQETEATEEAVDLTGGGLFDFGTETAEETVQETEASEEAVDLTGGGLFDFGTETAEASEEAVDLTGGGLFDFGTQTQEVDGDNSLIDAQTHESEPNLIEAQTHDSETEPVIIRIRRIVTPVRVSVMIEDEKVEFNSFRIGGDYFFELNDIATLFNGTDKQFSIQSESVQQIMGGVNPEDLGTVIDPAVLNNLEGSVISLKTKSPYIATGNELTYTEISAEELDKELSNTTTVLVDDVIKTVETYTVLGKEIFAMEDICRILDANFDFPETDDLQQIIVDTNKAYQ